MFSPSNDFVPRAAASGFSRILFQAADKRGPPHPLVR